MPPTGLQKVGNQKLLFFYCCICLPMPIFKIKQHVLGFLKPFLNCEQKPSYCLTVTGEENTIMLMWQ